MGYCRPCKGMSLGNDSCYAHILTHDYSNFRRLYGIFTQHQVENYRQMQFTQFGSKDLPQTHWSLPRLSLFACPHAKLLTLPGDPNREDQDWSC